ncbi:MAG: hypothetical protein FWC57_04150, partial [Endomicrobia bacterium]|nr:hypothetical protein [Endomicrobiia bacterium]
MKYIDQTRPDQTRPDQTRPTNKHSLKCFFKGRYFMRMIPAFKKIISIAVLASFLISLPGTNTFSFGDMATAMPRQETLSPDNPFEKGNNGVPAMAVVSSAYGKITEEIFFDSPETIINIQDLHCSAEVQKDIAALIGEINDKYAISGIYAEGGYGSIDTGWIAGVKDENERRGLLDVLLNAGRLTGAEYYSALNNKYEIIKGLEDKEIHRQNLLRLSRILSKQEQYERKLNDLEKDLGFLTERYLGSRNKRFDRITREYKAGKIGAAKYYALLKKYSENTEDGGMQKYPNISAYIKANELRGKLKYSAIQRQLGIFVNILKEKLPYSLYSEISAKTDNFSDIGSLYFYTGQITEKYGIGLGKDFSDLNLLFRYKQAENAINVKEMLEEENNLSQDIRIAFSKDSDEAETAFLSYFYAYFKKYLTNSLTADDYKYFVKKFGDFKYLWDKYNYENGLKGLEDDFKILDEYYRVNSERNEIFVRQLALSPLAVIPAKAGIHVNDKMDSPVLRPYGTGSSEEQKTLTHRNDKNGSGAGLPRSFGARNDEAIQPLNLSQSEIQNKLKNSRVMIVITGGFHSGGLKELLKQRHISCITVMPNITGGAAEAQKIYESLVKEQADVIARKDEVLTRQSSVVTAVKESGLPRPFSARNDEQSSLALALGSTDAQIKYENGRYIVNIDGETLEIYKNSATDKFEIKNLSEKSVLEDASNSPRITQTVKENILANIERIRGLSSPAGSAEVIYWLVREISKSGKLNSVMLGSGGLIWKIVSDPQMQKAIKENEGFSLNEVKIFNDDLQGVIANHAVLKEKFKDNPVINAVLNVPEFKTILSILSENFKIQNYLTPTFNEVKRYFDMLVSAAVVRTKVKARDVKGYEKYGSEVENYYKQRLNLLKAVQTLDADLY